MTHASLFSGIGGPEIAAAMLGWDNLFHCEINPFGRKVLEYWFPNSKSYEDITKTDFTEWRGRVDVLTGGFPCQPFSYAGQRRGANDDRYLWPYMFKAIDAIRPAWVVAENVAGITTMVEQGEVSEMGGQASLFEEVDDIHRYRLDETSTLQRICDDLESHGYAVQAVLIPACAVGAPHRRDRVFIVARRVTADTNHDGSCRREGNNGQERQDCANTKRNATSDGERDGLFGKPRTSGITKDAPHPDSHRGCEVDEHMESELADGAKPVSNVGQRNVADTESRRAGGLRIESEEEGARMRDVVFGNGCRLHLPTDEAGLGRWQDFPSVSPVHRGNDGLSIPPYYDAIYERRNSMDRNSIIQGALSTGKIEVDFSTGNIYSTRIRGHEGERIKLEGAECNGYIVHTLSFNGVKKQCRAHQIVWIAKNGIYDKDRWQIDHKNRNRKDNRLENLHLVSASENIANQKRPDTRILGDEDRFAIWKLYNEGHNSIREIAEDYGVSKSLVHKIVHEFPDLTLSFGKWRTESLKAYGNAIVPQVMYEIFRAIELVNNQMKGGEK